MKNNVEIKYLRGEELQCEEKLKREFLIQFWKCNNYFNTIEFDKTNYSYYKINMSNKYLYTLLKLGVNFKTVFGMDCYIMQI